MINHFRTLALNETASGFSADAARALHIDRSFSKVPLPADLASLYGFFYPTADVPLKDSFTKAYLGLIDGCGLTAATTVWDSRITYHPPELQTTLSTWTISVGVPTTENAEGTDIALRVYNYHQYDANWLTSTSTQTLSIEQQTNTTTVKVLAGLTVLATVSLTFTDGCSNLVSVPDPTNPSLTLFQFNIRHPNFTSTSGKKWEVLMTRPFSDLITHQYAEIRRWTPKINSILANRKFVEAGHYDDLWHRHFNENFRLAGLFIGLIYRINSLR